MTESHDAGTPSTAQPSATPPASAPLLPSPGTLLRQARERAGLGAEDLAGQLKLSKATLEALERDDFAALTEPVYVRGYYRKIAKVLGVPEAELVAAYNARSQPATTTPSMRRIPLAGGVAAGASRQSRGQGIWLAVVGIILLVVLAFALTDRQAPRRLAGIPAPAQTAPDASTGSLAPAVTPASESAPAPNGSAPGAAAGSTEPTAPPPDTPAPAPAPAATSAAPPATPAVTPPAIPNQLVLEFREASFVRVEDSRARTLAIGLVRGGERQALDGQPPYTVFLGNAQNVGVFFGGAPVDFSAHINRQNDTARFTVP
jgi:cytoskeleton protein RodZ